MMCSVDLQCTLCVCCHGNGHMVGEVGQPAHSMCHHLHIYFRYQFFIADFSLIPRPSSKEERSVSGFKTLVDLGSTVWTVFLSKILVGLLFFCLLNQRIP